MCRDGVLIDFRSCTNSRSIQIRESELPVARRKIAGILCVFQDFSTRPAAIWAAKLGAEAIGTASKDNLGRFDADMAFGHFDTYWNW